METTTTVNSSLFDTFRKSIIPGEFVRVEYLTDLHEFIKTDVLIKRIDTNAIEIGTGEEISIDRIVRIDGVLSPNFPGYESYSCDC